MKIPSDIIKYATQAGLTGSTENIIAFVTAIAGGNAAAASSVPGVTAEIVAAGFLGLQVNIFSKASEALELNACIVGLRRRSQDRLPCLDPLWSHLHRRGCFYRRHQALPDRPCGCEVIIKSLEGQRSSIGSSLHYE